MVEMRVAGIALDAASRSPIVLLRDPSGRRQVPIWIDQAQAQNIMAGLSDQTPPRPLSHDLMVELLQAGGLELTKVIVHAIEDSTFRAVLKLRTEGDEAVVGITAYAADELGDIVFVELPEEGTEVAKDDEVVVIESVKAASDILAPIDGEIVEVNEVLVEDPSKVNDDPMGDAWFFKIKPSDPSQMDDYMDEAAYAKFIA